jgi:hypothetical protein
MKKLFVRVQSFFPDIPNVLERIACEIGKCPKLVKHEEDGREKM